MSNSPSYSDETLRDYARGRLSAAEASAIEAAARTDHRLAAEIALIKGVVASGEAAKRDARSPELGWARLSRAIDAETRTASSGLPKQFSRWQVAAVAALAIAVSSVVTTQVASNDQDTGYVTVSEKPVYAHSAQVTFVATVQEGSIREALRAVEAEIVQGPSALGVYVLAFEDDEARDKGVVELRSRSDLVDSVTAE